MRTTQEIIKTMTIFSEETTAILAAALYGTRANSQNKIDEYQGYNFLLLTDTPENFKKQEEWILSFGKPIISHWEKDLNDNFSCSVLFSDYAHIHFTFAVPQTLSVLAKTYAPLKILCDKKELFATILEKHELTYDLSKPTVQEFDALCNEFWWLSAYCIKGIARKEILFSVEVLAGQIRPLLLKMMAWEVGTRNDFSINIGENYRFLPNFLEPSTLEELYTTHQMTTVAELWESLFMIDNLFRIASKKVAKALSFPYPEYDVAVSKYLSLMYIKHIDVEAEHLF